VGNERLHHDVTEQEEPVRHRQLWHLSNDVVRSTTSNDVCWRASFQCLIAYGKIEEQPITMLGS
jgi:hypothetical protein